MDESLLLKLGYKGIEPLLAQLQLTNNFDVPTATIVPTPSFGGKASWGNITGDINAQKDLQDKFTAIQKEVEEAVAEIATVFVYKGSVATFNDLPTENNKVGDCWNVTDTGNNYAWNGTEWDNLAGITDLSAYVTKETLSGYYTKEETDKEVANVKTEVGDLSTEVDNTLATQSGSIQSLSLQMTELQSRITELKSLDPEVVVLYDGGDSEFSNKEKDFTLSGAITTPTTIAGNNVELKEATMTAATVAMLAAQDITIKGLTVTGEVPKTVSNRLIAARADGYINIRDCEINTTKAYNGIEVGLDSTAPKAVTIDNIDFSGHLTNNAINVFGMAENGVLTISNCHFADVSNVVRISNRLDTHWTINIINCTCDNWDTRDEWRGMMIFQDNYSSTAEEANKKNTFKKLTVNIQNFTKPDGNKLVATDLAKICTTLDENQIFILWDEVRGYVAYDADKYPIINIV